MVRYDRALYNKGTWCCFCLQVNTRGRVQAGWPCRHRVDFIRNANAIYRRSTEPTLHSAVGMSGGIKNGRRASSAVGCDRKFELQHQKIVLCVRGDCLAFRGDFHSDN